jgi:hypothetical protein
MIQWMFSTQLHYEGRFESDDKVHRLLKGVHVLMFLWIGITSEKWSVKNLIEPDAVPAAHTDDALWVQHRKPLIPNRADLSRASIPELYDRLPRVRCAPSRDRGTVHYG